MIRMTATHRLFFESQRLSGSQRRRLWPVAVTLLLLAAISQPGRLIAQPVAFPGVESAVEWTTVTGTLGGLPNNARPGGVVFLVIQRRLIEIPPGPGALNAVAARAEGSAAVSAEGNFSLRLPPGNYILVWDPNASADASGQILSPVAEDPTQPIGILGRPGSESLLLTPTDEASRTRVAEARRRAIAAAAESGAPTVIRGNILNTGNRGEGRLPVVVAFNRFVRPPAVDFGDWSASGSNEGIIRITLKESDGRALTRGGLRIRGHNGDMLEPLPLGRVTSGERPVPPEPGVFVFRDLQIQPYQAVLQDAPPPPPAGAAPGILASALIGSDNVPKPTDRPKSRTIQNPDFVHDGTSQDLTMTVEPIKN
jgi:hypothetical protein